MNHLLGRRGEPAAAEGDLEGADVVAVAGADVEQLEDAPTHKHLENWVKTHCHVPSNGDVEII